jgi:hypothetical protein
MIVTSNQTCRWRVLKNMKYGIFRARRGLLRMDDVLNTRKAAELLHLLKR